MPCPTLVERNGQMVKCGKKLQPHGRCEEKNRGECSGHCGAGHLIDHGCSKDLGELEKVHKVKFETTGAGASKRKRDATESALKSGSSAEEAEQAGLQAAGGIYNRQREHLFNTIGAGAGKLFSEAQAKALADGSTEDEAVTAGFNAGGELLRLKRQRTFDTQGGAAGERFREAHAKALADGLTEDEAVTAGFDAGGDQLRRYRQSHSDTRGAGAGKRRRTAKEEALALGASESEANEAGLVAGGDQLRLAIKRHSNYRAVRISERNRLIESNLLERGSTMPPLPDTRSLNREALTLAGVVDRLDGRIVLPDGIVITASVVPANLGGPFGLPAQLFEMLQGILGRAYCYIRIRINRYTGRRVLSMQAFILEALKRNAIFFVITDNLLRHQAFDVEREAQKLILLHVKRSSRGFTNAGVGDSQGGPALRATAIGGLNLNLLDDLIESVDESTRVSLLRSSIQQRQQSASARRLALSSSSAVEVDESPDSIESLIVMEASKDDSIIFDGDAEGDVSESDLVSNSSSRIISPQPLLSDPDDATTRPGPPEDESQIGPDQDFFARLRGQSAAAVATTRVSHLSLLRPRANGFPIQQNLSSFFGQPSRITADEGNFPFSAPSKVPPSLPTPTRTVDTGDEVLHLRQGFQNDQLAGQQVLHLQQVGAPARNPTPFVVASRTTLSSSGQKTIQSESTKKVSSNSAKVISNPNFFGLQPSATAPAQVESRKVSLLGYEGGRAVHPSPPVLSNSYVAPIVPSTLSKKRQRDDNEVGVELDSKPSQKPPPSQSKDPPGPSTFLPKTDS
jgi:hypothetical protein